MDIGPAEAADTPAVLDVVRAAFGDEGDRVAGLVRALLEETDEGGTPRTLRASLVARAPGGEVAGHVALTRGWLDADRRLVEVLVLSPCRSDPTSRGRGSGAGSSTPPSRRPSGSAHPWSSSRATPRTTAASGSSRPVGATWSRRRCGSPDRPARSGCCRPSRAG